MSETDEEALPEPLRVTERVVSAYQWDLWREAVLRGSRRDEVLSIAMGVLTGIAAAALGLDLFDDRVGRLSVLIYTPLIGAGVWAWARSWLQKRQARRVGEEVRSLVVPALTHRISDHHVFTLLTGGGASMIDVSTVVRAVRQDSAVTLVATEYDMSLYPSWNGSGEAGGGGG